MNDKALQGRGISKPTHLASVWASAGVLFALGAGAPAVFAQTVIEVKRGDTFSAIAARYTGSERAWRKLYNPQLSGLKNPDLISAGMRFELVTEAGGARYLRLLDAAAPDTAAAPAPVAAPAAAPAAAVAPARPAAATATPAPAAAPAMAPAVTLPVAGAAGTPLVIGLLPNIGAQALQSQYDNLKRYLERVGGYKVRIVLPSNFKAFYDGTMRGDFDLAVAAPHFARVAQVDRGMVPLVMYEPRINALLVSPIEGGIGAAREVREKAVAFANPTSLVAMFGQQWLTQQRLEPGKDYEVKGARTDVGVGRMLLAGEAAAAIMSNGEFRALPADESARLKIVEVFARMPNFIMLGHPRLDRDRLARLKTQLRGFIADGGDEGAAFSKATGFTAVVDADDATLRELDPYVAQTRRVMGPVN